MAERGEQSFVKLPRFGAKMYDRLVAGTATRRQVEEIAEVLVARASHGRLLDIGTGPARLLLAIHRLDPQVELHGLDISEAMVRLARENLGPVAAELRVGSIERTDYADASFDVVTCTGSFYLWNRPDVCLAEIHRLLRHGRSAFLFESRRDYDDSALRRALATNLKNEDALRRLVAPAFLRKQLRMTYSTDEIRDIVARSPFAGSSAVEPVVLAGLPIWLRIVLTKV